MADRDLLLRLLNALSVCDDHRGAFSCHEPHDCRCPKDRDPIGNRWKGEWVCMCGREELDAAIKAAMDALIAAGVRW